MNVASFTPPAYARRRACDDPSWARWRSSTQMLAAAGGGSSGFGGGGGGGGFSGGGGGYSGGGGGFYAGGGGGAAFGLVIVFVIVALSCSRSSDLARGAADAGRCAEQRAARVRLASVEAAQDDPAFAAEVVEGGCAALFSDIQAPGTRTTSRRSAAWSATT